MPQLWRAVDPFSVLNILADKSELNARASLALILSYAIIEFMSGPCVTTIAFWVESAEFSGCIQICLCRKPNIWPISCRKIPNLFLRLLNFLKIRSVRGHSPGINARATWFLCLFSSSAVAQRTWGRQFSFGSVFGQTQHRTLLANSWMSLSIQLDKYPIYDRRSRWDYGFLSAGQRAG